MTEFPFRFRLIYRHDEIAFCSLACQTRALLIVAETQAQQQQQDEKEQGLSTQYLNEAGPDSSEFEGQQHNFPYYYTPSEQNDYSQQSPAQLLQSDRIHTNPVRDRPKTPVSVQAAPKPSRPPLHTRHSVAVVNNLVNSSSGTPSTFSTSSSRCAPLQHPIMASLRSDMFSLSAIRNPLPGRAPSVSTSKVTGELPSSEFLHTPASPRAPAHTPLAAPGSPSLFPSPLLPRNSDTDSLSSAEALYRMHYPKFASRRHLRDQSPNNWSPRMADSYINVSSSAGLDLENLTPPSIIRPMLVLPEVPTHRNGNAPPPPTPRTQTKVDSVVLQPDVHMAAPPPPSLPLSQPASASPLLKQTPERRSAPRRSLDISPNILSVPLKPESQPTTVEPISRSSQASHGNVLRPPLYSSGSSSSRKSDHTLTHHNSLGLEVQHVENSSSISGSASPNDYPMDLKENIETTNHDKYLSPNKAKSSNPVSPPKVRSRIISMHTAPNIGRRDIPGKDGWSSVEASRYTLGPREASYIVRKLSEEQKIRQQKERAAARDEAMENRGRSRARKRAGSWGNALTTTQSIMCELTCPITMRSMKRKLTLCVVPQNSTYTYKESRVRLPFRSVDSSISSKTVTRPAAL